MEIGGQFFALTLNLILTAVLGFLGGVALFWYTRRQKRQDAKQEQTQADQERLKAERDDALARMIDERHDTLVGMITDSKEAFVKKINDFCDRQERLHKEEREQFVAHYHEKETGNVVLRKSML